MQKKLLLCLLLCAAPAWGDSFSVKFEAEVIDCNLCLPEWKVEVGDKIKGGFDFDLKAEDVLPDDEQLGIYRSELPFSVSVGKLDFTAQKNSVTVQNNGNGIPNEGYFVSCGWAGGEGCPATPEGLPIATFGFLLVGSSKDLFASDALVPPPGIDNFLIKGFVLTVFTGYSPEGYTWATISGNLTKLDVKQVPEPAAWVLILAGLGLTSMSCLIRGTEGFCRRGRQS